MTTGYDHQRFIAAHHEAGHLAVLLALGAKIHSVSIEAIDGTSGRVIYTAPNLGPKERIAIALAGAIMETRLSPEHPALHHLRGSDLEAIWMEVAVHYGGPVASGLGELGIVNDAHSLAAGVISQNLPLIEAVATRLLEVETILGTELDQRFFGVAPPRTARAVPRVASAEPAPLAVTPTRPTSPAPARPRPAPVHRFDPTVTELLSKWMNTAQQLYSPMGAMLTRVMC